MIRYALKCAEGHSFESWFQSADAFDTLKGAGHVACPHCGTEDVNKAIMAPRVRPARSAASAPPEADRAPETPAQGAGPGAPNSAPPNPPAPSAAPAPAPTGPTGATGPSSPAELEAALTKLREHVEKTSEYVGSNFAAEARAMSDGSSPERSIYGEARPDEAQKLIEEGVPIAPLPFLPTRKVN